MPLLAPLPVGGQPGQALLSGLAMELMAAISGEMDHLIVVHRSVLSCSGDLGGSVASDRNDGPKGWGGASGEPFSSLQDRLRRLKPG